MANYKTRLDSRRGDARRADSDSDSYPDPDTHTGAYCHTDTSANGHTYPNTYPDPDTERELTANKRIYRPIFRSIRRGPQ